MMRYHDDEWGRPMRDERRLFEKLSLEAFQSGLSWLTILRKRDAFRAAFYNFDARRIARMNARDVKRLLADEGIVRHRGKIEATIANARALCALVDDEGAGAFARLVWSFAPAKRAKPLRSRRDLAGDSDAARALSKTLKQRGFRFVGPTTVYAFMQAAGLVDDHLHGCFRARV
jgi:DNA-3-methyladenine glycosylase I